MSIHSELIEASSNNDLQRCKELIHAGASVYTDNKKAFQMACLNGNLEIAKLIINSIPNEELENKSYLLNDSTAHSYAASNGNLEILEYIYSFNSEQLEIKFTDSTCLAANGVENFHGKFNPKVLEFLLCQTHYYPGPDIVYIFNCDQEYNKIVLGYLAQRNIIENKKKLDNTLENRQPAKIKTKI